MVAINSLRNILFLIVLSSNAFAQTDSQSTIDIQPILHLYDIADQTQEDIATILGPQSSLNAEDAKAAVCANCQKYSYQNDRIIIEYTNDMADRIIIWPEKNNKAELTPSLLGLPNKKPDSIQDGKLLWKGYDGIRELIAFTDGNGAVTYILIKVITD
ncbi:hypothetical protein [Persicitalea jodogahamensis]|nr:hypothetical protein [Persicitalea jodogahamensis]